MFCPAEGLRPSNPQFVVVNGNQKKIFLRSELLKLPSLKQLSIANDPAYAGHNRTYSAIPVSTLFKGIAVGENSVIAFSCSDGFSALISTKKLLNTDPQQSMAYLAVETTKDPWPPLKPGDAATAGPFYLIWENPDKSNIVTEEWPYQLVSFEVKISEESQYPLLVPGESVPPQSSIEQGYHTFMKNCFACHSLNGEGKDKMGPDLNIPFSPTEYMKPDYLVRLVRDPQGLRHWPQAKMPGFKVASLSEVDLKNLIDYLDFMAKKKKTSK
jgi:mono/diheme cytochrome c family protein